MALNGFPSATFNAPNHESLKLSCTAALEEKPLDPSARLYRLKKQIDALEQDNFQEDPHANVTWHKKIPKFDDETGDTSQHLSGTLRTSFSRRKKLEHIKKLKKSFSAMLAEEKLVDEPNYFSCQAPPSKFPARRFCAVCGFKAQYVCMRCGARYCSLRCLGVHKDTRYFSCTER
ncbi:unnamed protein product [Soboliphyme baturini]|uniref:HIT-type domain-containing protein n=1 Tax=Soboliphyme baturini TaxID=241478 RepID=A0A3P8AVA9_9BILA|nr:unnamed protein product [Soboliphyme baturini]